MSPPLSDADAYRWTLFVRELEHAAAGSTLPVDLTSLPITVVTAGEGSRLVAIAGLLLAALRTHAELLAPASIGPRHHALAATLAAVAAAGLTLDPVLAAARAQWAAPPPRRQAPRGLDGLVPHIPPKRR